MKTILILFICSVPAFGQWQRSERIIEVPQPPARVRQYIPQDVDVPQPPLRYKEITETRSYTVPLDEPVRYSAPVYATPVYSAPAYYAAPVKYAAPAYYAVPVYAAPRRIKPTPVRDFFFGR